MDTFTHLLAQCRPRRRTILRAGLLTACVPALSGCENALSTITGALGSALPQSLALPADQPEVDPAFHLLNRAGFGPWPGDLARVRQLGVGAWIDEQLNPAAINDTACDLRARRFETIHLDPALCYEFKKPVLRSELVRHTLLRAVYSQRQLFECLVAFWSNHLNINLEKGDCIYLKATDDRTVIRAHALGKFRDLIHASATSGAMLVYLDGKDNKKSAPSDVPNENYARELLELHTLGVDGGYTQHDVSEVARCLTGWTLRGRWRRGEVTFDPARHDDGPKRVLGHDIPAAGGAQDLDTVIDIVAAHPATATHIARKLCEWFIADDPPSSVIADTAQVFTATAGDLRATVRAVLLSPAFSAPDIRATKVKTPLRFLASALRAVAADTHAHAPLTGFLEQMGQALFQYPTPEGYSPEPTHVLGTLLWRWNFAFALANGAVPTVSTPLPALWSALDHADPALAQNPAAALLRHFVGRAPTAAELAALADFNALQTDGPSPTLVALLLASPAFQRF